MIRARFAGVPQISTSELATWLESERQPPLLLDARTEEEFAVSHLATAQLAPPDPDALQLPPDTPIVVYCSVGYRSSRLTEQLQQRGYTNVSNLEGSIFEWANQGHPVYQNDRPVHSVHPYNPTWGLLLKPTERSQ